MRAVLTQIWCLRFLQLTISLLFALIFSSTAEAAKYTLFTRGVQNPSYDIIVQKLHPGDEIAFSDGKSFKVQSLKGHGQTSLIVEISDAQIIRIPLKSGVIKNVFGRPIEYRSFISSFYKGMRDLRRLGVEVVNVQGYYPNEYVAADNLALIFTFDEFLSGKFPMSISQRDKLVEEFYKWVESTSFLAKIGDYHHAQVGYDSRSQKWILFDCTDANISISDIRRSISAPKDEIIFDDLISSSPLQILLGNSLFSDEKLNKILYNARMRIYAVRARRAQKNCADILSKGPPPL